MATTAPCSAPRITESPSSRPSRASRLPIVSRIEEDERKTPIPDELLDFLERHPDVLHPRPRLVAVARAARPAPRLARAGDGLGAAAVREALRRPHAKRAVRRRPERAGGEGARPAAVDTGRRATACPGALPRGPGPHRLDRRARRGRHRDRPAHRARLGPHQRGRPTRYRHDRRRGAQARQGRARAAPGGPGRSSRPSAIAGPPATRRRMRSSPATRARTRFPCSSGPPTAGSATTRRGDSPGSGEARGEETPVSSSSSSP